MPPHEYIPEEVGLTLQRVFNEGVDYSPTYKSVPLILEAQQSSLLAMNTVMTLVLSPMLMLNHEWLVDGELCAQQWVAGV